MVDFIAMLKCLPDMNKMEVARTIITNVDTNNTVLSVLMRMKPMHMKISLASYMMVYMLKIAGQKYEMMNNHEFWFEYYKSLAETFFQNGVEMVTEKYQDKYQIAMATKPIPSQCFYHPGKPCELSTQNLDDDDDNHLNDKYLSPEELERRHVAAKNRLFTLIGVEPPTDKKEVVETTPTTTATATKFTFDRDFIQPNDILSTSKGLTKAERARLIEEDKRKLKNLQARFEKMMVDIQYFQENFVSDSTIVQMIQDKNIDLFNTNLPHMQKISLFDPENFHTTFRAPDAPGFEPKKHCVRFRTIGQYWNFLIRNDQIFHREMCAHAGHEVPEDQAESHQATLWYNLNNAVLLSTLLSNLKDEDLTKLFTCVYELYDDFLKSKINDLDMMYNKVIDEVRRIFPTSFHGNTIGKPSKDLKKFLFEALIQNAAYFQDVVAQIQYAIPAVYKQALKDNGWCDIDSFNLKQKLREQMKKIWKHRNELNEEETTPQALSLVPTTEITTIRKRKRPSN